MQLHFRFHFLNGIVCHLFFFPMPFLYLLKNFLYFNFFKLQCFYWFKKIYFFHVILFLLRPPNRHFCNLSELFILVFGMSYPCSLIGSLFSDDHLLLFSSYLWYVMEVLSHWHFINANSFEWSWRIRIFDVSKASSQWVLKSIRSVDFFFA